MLKHAIDNIGDVVITDGKKYAGMFTLPNKVTANNEWEGYDYFEDEEIKSLGIDKITNWQEIKGEEDD